MEFETGQRVCIKGIGTSALLHVHGTVERLTKTQAVINVRGSQSTRRFYREPLSAGHNLFCSVSGGDYGRSYATIGKCQVKETS